MNYDLVSVVIPTYGRADYLEQAIASVQRQTYKNVEIVVVDDNGNGSLIQKDVEKRVDKYQSSQFQYIVLEKNSGGAVARNVGIQKARGKWIAFLDDDDLLLPEYIEEMLKELCKSKNDVIYEAHWYYLYDNMAFCAKKLPEKKEGNLWKETLTAKIPISIFLLFDKEKVQQIGLFDIDIRAYDDYDLWLQWSRKLKFACLLRPLAVVRKGNEKHITTDTKGMRIGLNKIIEKWMPLLSEEEQKLFGIFIKKHECRISEQRLYNMSGQSIWARIGAYAKHISKYEQSKKAKCMLLLEILCSGSVRKIKTTIFRKNYYVINYEKN